jgi:hypothetical protein
VSPPRAPLLRRVRTHARRRAAVARGPAAARGRTKSKKEMALVVQPPSGAAAGAGAAAAPPLALPDWLLPENDASAAQSGLLRPEEGPSQAPSRRASSSGAGGSISAYATPRAPPSPPPSPPPPPRRSSGVVATTSTALTTTTATTSPCGRGGDAASSAARRAARHAAVSKALSGGGAIDWGAPIPTLAPGGGAYPLWLAPELDVAAANEGALRPSGAGGEAAPAKPRLAPPPPRPNALPPPRAAPAALPPAARADVAARTAAGLARHEAVHAALRGAGGSSAQAGPAWDAPIPANAPDAPPYPLWLAPELDALGRVHPGAAPPGARMPAQNSASALDPYAAALLTAKPAPPPRNKVFSLEPANSGDQIVLMRHNEPGAPSAHHRVTLMNHFGGAGHGWPEDAPPAQPPARQQAKAAPAAAQERWHYSWEGVADDDDDGNGRWGGGNGGGNGGGGSGPTLAMRIQAVVASHEPDARAFWR